MTALLDLLGYDSGDRVLLISCENLGWCHAANMGVYESLRSGLATSASLMVPAPWAREAVKGYRGADVGVHLTLNADDECYRWGPITMSPSLLDGNGGFPSTVADLWEHADVDEVRRECRAQVERAILWGFDVTHLDSHLDALVPRPEFFDIYLELAVDFGVPLRLENATDERNFGFAFRRRADEEGILSPDQIVRLGASDRRTAFENTIFSLDAGVTEIIFQPAVDTPEVRAATPHWARRVEDHQILTNDSAARELVARAGVKLISYAAIKAAQARLS